MGQNFSETKRLNSCDEFNPQDIRHDSQCGSNQFATGTPCSTSKHITGEQMFAWKKGVTNIQLACFHSLVPAGSGPGQGNYT